MTTECAPTIEATNDREALPPIVMPPRVSRWKRIFRSFWMRLFLLVLIFSAGSVTGYCIGSIWTESNIRETMQRPRTEFLMTHFQKSLELTDEQYPVVENIVRRHYTALEKIRQEMAPLYVAEFDQMDQDMQGVLTESQRELWKPRAARMRDFWASGRPPSRGDRRKRGDGERSKEHKPDHKTGGLQKPELDNRADKRL